MCYTLFLLIISSVRSCDAIFSFLHIRSIRKFLFFFLSTLKSRACFAVDVAANFCYSALCIAIRLYHSEFSDSMNRLLTVCFIPLHGMKNERDRVQCATISWVWCSSLICSVRCVKDFFSYFYWIIMNRHQFWCTPNLMGCRFYGVFAI